MNLTSVGACFPCPPPLLGCQISTLGVIIGFCGIIVLVGPEALKGFGGAVFSQLAIAVAAVCYAINAVLTRNLPNGGVLGSMIGRAFMVMICGAIITIPLALIMDGPMAYLQAEGYIYQIMIGYNYR